MERDLSESLSYQLIGSVFSIYIYIYIYIYIHDFDFNADLALVFARESFLCIVLVFMLSVFC